MKERKQSRGITLIALVVTIIVLLILAGVSIAMVFGQNGIVTKAIAAREQTEMANLKEQAELIRLQKQTEEWDGGEKVTKDTLIDAIYQELGKEKIADGVVSKDGKYDILVDDNLKITVVKHGESGDSGDDGDETGKQEVDDLMVPIITENDTTTMLSFYLNIEQYYPELIENIIINIVQLATGDETINSFDAAKQWLVTEESSPLIGRDPSTLTINDIINDLGLGKSPNEFFYGRQGYLFLLETEEQKMKYTIDSYRLIFGILNQELWKYDDKQMLQYMIENVDDFAELADKDINSITFEDLVCANGKYSSEEEAWYDMLGQILNGEESETNEGTFSIMAPIVMTCIFPNSTIQLDGEAIASYKTIYIFDKSQTCTIHLETDKYICTQTHDITINPLYNTKTELYTDVDGNSAYVPEGFRLVSENENINKGLRIEDRNNNEFVWIPVSDSDLQKMIDETNGAGKLYTFDSNGTATYNGLETIDSSDKSDFDAMVASVKKYKGFYVGRYETIITDKTNLKCRIKSYSPLNLSGKDNINIGTYDTMFSAQKNLDTNSISVSTHMIWGCQWDYIMQWVNGTKPISGDIYNVGTAVKDRHKYSTLSGYNSYDNVKNILDLEGFHKEWTAEKVLRGGENTTIIGIGEIEPASKRTETSLTNNNGSRMVMYLK